MQAKKRYILVFVSCAFLAYCYFGGYRLKRSTSVAVALAKKCAIALDNDIQSYLAIGEYDSLFGDISGPSNDRLSEAFLDPNGELNGAVDIAVDGDVVTAAQMLLVDQPEQESPKQQQEAVVAAVVAPVVEIPALDPSASKKIGLGKRTRPCRMETCFDYTKCYEAHQQLLVYVYPSDSFSTMGTTPPTSLNYQKILSAITESRYYTTDPDRACLFILGIDTLDRDSLSEDYVRNVPSRLQRLSHWNNGRNHVIFNLYSGTWPDYAENSLGFDTGEAILAKASMSVRQIRPGFDISIPLFHKQHPLRAGNNGFVSSNNFPTNKKYLLAFKGKR